MTIVPQRTLTIAEIDRAYLQLCTIAPRLERVLTPARALLLAGAYLDEACAQTHFPLGAIYDLERDCCSCDHAGPDLCLHQVAMRIRRLAIGHVLLAEVRA